MYVYTNFEREPRHKANVLLDEVLFPTLIITTSVCNFPYRTQSLHSHSFQWPNTTSPVLLVKERVAMRHCQLTTHHLSFQ